MPDGSALPDDLIQSRATKPSTRPRDVNPRMSAVPLVGNPTGLLYRLRFIDQQLAEMDNDASTGGRWSYVGRGLHREAQALVDLAVTQSPGSMADCVAVIAAAYEKIGDVYREERPADEMTKLLEAPMDALERVANFVAAEIGLRAQDFGGDWIFVGDCT